MVTTIAVATPYDSLVQAASQLVGVELLDDLDSVEISGLPDLVERNCPLLASARITLSQKCEVPLRYEASFFSEHSDDYACLRNLCRAFRAELLHAASRRDLNSAACFGIDMLELSNATRRGGLVCDALISIAFAGIAIEELRKIRCNLDRTARASLLDDLERIESEREPLSDIFARDQEWERIVGYEDEPRDFLSQEIGDPEECGLSKEEQRQILEVLQQIADLPKASQDQMQLDQDNSVVASLRMLRIDLAIRTWAVENGRWPATLDLLTPDPFQTLPLDPYMDSAFVYRVVDDKSFLLYSVGPKGFDAGGRFGPWRSVAAGQADWGLDAYDHCQEDREMTTRQGILASLWSRLRAWWG